MSNFAALIREQLKDEFSEGDRGRVAPDGSAVAKASPGFCRSPKSRCAPDILTDPNTDAVRKAERLPKITALRNGKVMRAATEIFENHTCLHDPNGEIYPYPHRQRSTCALGSHWSKDRTHEVLKVIHPCGVALTAGHMDLEIYIPGRPFSEPISFEEDVVIAALGLIEGRRQPTRENVLLADARATTKPAQTLRRCVWLNRRAFFAAFAFFLFAHLRIHVLFRHLNGSGPIKY